MKKKWKKVFDSNFKREIIIGVFILLLTIIIQMGGWLLSRNYAKTDNLISKQIELTDKLNRDLQDFFYLTQFSINQAVLKFHIINDLPLGLEEPGEVYLSQEIRLLIDDTLRIKYPTIYTKSLEADLKATQLNATLTQTVLHFKNENIHKYVDSIKDIISPHKVFTDFTTARLKKSKSKISEIELEEFMTSYHKELLKKMNNVLNLMVTEYMDY